MEAVIFMFCLTLHNTEEALWLIKWNKKNMHGTGEMPNQQQFLFAVLGVTVLGYLAAGLFLLFPQNGYFELCFLGFVGSMLINAWIPHIALTIKYRKYCPGVLTGCLLLIPFNSMILYRAVMSQWKASEIAIATVAVGVILLAAIPVLKHLGKEFLQGLYEESATEDVEDLKHER